MKNRDNTGVDAICYYGNGSQVPKFDQAKVYQELRSMTNNITRLGIYNLDNKSLYINGKGLIFLFLQALEQLGATWGLREDINAKKKKMTLRKRWSHWSLVHNLCV